MLHTTTGYGYQLGSSNKTILVLRIKKESRDCTPLCTHHIFCRDVFRENWPPWKVATLSTPHPIDRNKKAPESISLFATQSCSSPCAQNGSNALCLLVETMICWSITLEPPGTEHRKSFWPAQQISCVLGSPKRRTILSATLSTWIALLQEMCSQAFPPRLRRGRCLSICCQIKDEISSSQGNLENFDNTGECITKDHLGLGLGGNMDSWICSTIWACMYPNTGRLRKYEIKTLKPKNVCRHPNKVMSWIPHEYQSIRTGAATQS